jgi:DNA end-binding protein Ku
MVVITDEEFASAAPEKSRDIELKRFVSLADIPPSFFDRPYFLAPDERAGKAYALLAQTMAKTARAGIGSFVMRDHEYLVAILAENGILRAEVLRHADELRTPATIGLPEPGKADASSVRAMAKEIDALSKPGLDMHEMADLEAETLRKFAQQKAKKGAGVISMDELEGPDDESPGGSAQVIDLMEVLRKSIGATAGSAAAPKTASTTSTPPAAKRRAGKTPVKKAAARKSPAKKPAANKKPHAARHA